MNASDARAGAGRLLRLTLDGNPFEAPVPPGTTLLQMLREDAGRNGPRYGCGLGECGACTVLIDGKVARACVIPAHGVAGRSIRTLDGLAGDGVPHPVQQAFIEAQAAQCGYCTNGMVMATVALLSRCPDPDEQTVREALSHNLCRCGAHLEILEAVRRAAALVREAPARGTA
jgi:nicotinate dehydrogenase subunit A